MEKDAFQAAGRGDATLLARRLSEGVSPDLIGGRGDSLLVVAVHNRQAACARVLLDHGANPNGVKSDGEPLWRACYRDDNAECIREILTHGADPNCPQCPESGYTALMFLAAEPDYLSNMVELLRNAPNLDARNNEDESPLTYACAYGNLGAVKLLLDAGVEVNARVCKGETALLVATGAQNETTNAIIELLLDRGADPNIAGTAGNPLVPYWIPLMSYIPCQGPYHRNLPTFRRLASLTRDINYKTPDGKTAMTFSRESGFAPYVDLLREFGASED